MRKPDFSKEHIASIIRVEEKAKQKPAEVGGKFGERRLENRHNADYSQSESDCERADVSVHYICLYGDITGSKVECI
jgi:hypothetical protein